MPVTRATSPHELQRELLGWFGGRRAPATCRGGGRATPTRSSSARSCCSRRRSRACSSATTAWLERWPTPAALAAAPTADVLRAWSGLGYNRRALNLQRAARRVVELGGVPARDRRAGALARRRPVHRARDRVLRVRRPGDGARHQRAPRARAHARHDRRAAAARAAPGSGTRRSSTSARRSASPACPAASAARSPTCCPSRGQRFAPLRRQSRFEGSRRQRRAALVRELADGPARRATATIVTSSIRCSPMAWPCAARTACSRCQRR